MICIIVDFCILNVHHRALATGFTLKRYVSGGLFWGWHEKTVDGGLVGNLFSFVLPAGQWNVAFVMSGFVGTCPVDFAQTTSHACPGAVGPSTVAQIIGGAKQGCERYAVVRLWIAHADLVAKVPAEPSRSAQTTKPPKRRILPTTTFSFRVVEAIDNCASGGAWPNLRC